jgi:hypothetical protein
LTENLRIFSHNNIPASKILSLRNVEKYELIFVEKIYIYFERIFAPSPEARTSGNYFL